MPSSPDLPSGPFCFGAAKLARRIREQSSGDEKSKVTERAEMPVSLFGRPMEPHEYKEACRSLREFFELLRAWRQEGENDETD